MTMAKNSEFFKKNWGALMITSFMLIIFSKFNLKNNAMNEVKNKL